MERRTFMAGLAGLVSAGVVDFVPTPHQVGYFPTKEPKASLCLRKLNPISYLNQFNISQKQGLEGGQKVGRAKSAKHIILSSYENPHDAFGSFVGRYPSSPRLPGPASASPLLAALLRSRPSPSQSLPRQLLCDAHRSSSPRLPGLASASPSLAALLRSRPSPSQSLPGQMLCNLPSRSSPRLLGLASAALRLAASLRSRPSPSQSLPGQMLWNPHRCSSLRVPALASASPSLAALPRSRPSPSQSLPGQMLCNTHS